MSEFVGQTDQTGAGRRFIGRTTVVTGAAGEIGGAVVARLAAEGATVLAVDRTPVEPAGPSVHPHLADVDAGRGRSGGGTPGTFDGGRYAAVDEVVGAVCFLLGPDAGFVSGTALTVDGARTA
jgi:3-oxoacyl-[acyl-carrier protein] reductase